ncbi:hypothetical protein CULT_380033 [[Clostridium] ultunense Esp]|nr:hypothetical protein CULT_380033 [[Clostridium] ultunense Esp]
MEPDFSVYSLDEAMQEMDDLSWDFPRSLRIEEIGHSVKGYPIFCIILGRGRDHIQISGTHHAREWITTWLILRMIREYASALEEKKALMGYDLSSLLTAFSLHFIPVVNPDGYLLATEGWEKAGLSYEAYRRMADVSGIDDRYWLWKANLRGVDLNRQYDMNWERIRNSPNYPAAMNYKGREPYSEPEVEAMLRRTTEVLPLAVLAYHTAGEEIYWYHGQSGKAKERDGILAKELAKKLGYRLVGEEKEVAGGYADWFVDLYKRPGFTIEVGREPHPVDLTQGERIWEENKEGPLYLLSQWVNLSS